MASGFGATHGKGRCYVLWSDFMKCMEKSDGFQSCKDSNEDYKECLHHVKTVCLI